ncbi:YfbM family protein [Actinomadura macrotermitis]|uniref:DUF1877 family protein n=1 Tax=Actinomadura macrotermitis TaxID=2585200 RepID=A0A7K0BZP9_9ACTN|nr:YfbM family protein [Actinomadura macrotermitis]MQY06675.1 hypothetical protein [Actinomadura macrotermitis]
MSMIGEYVRLTPAELERTIGDPAAGRELVDRLIEAELDEAPGPSRARCHDIDKTWQALDFLLHRAGFPVDIAYGEEQIPGADAWGYGPPRYLTPERVRAAVAAFPAFPHHALAEGVTPADLAKADIYPHIVWERGEPLEYVTYHYASLVEFFQAAARDGHAVVTWIG